MIIKFDNRNVLVCGASQGIGLAAAQVFAASGANVTLLARDKSKLEEALITLPKSEKQNYEYIVADFSNPNELQSTLASYLKHHPPFDILVNNTGGPPAGNILNAQNDEFIQAFNNHLICNHILATCLIPNMKQNGFGRIINVISTSVKQPISGLGVSNTIRAAVGNWAKTLASEVAPWGITVNNVLPGATSTQRLSAIFQNKATKSNKTVDTIQQEMIDEIPAKRFAAPEEIANAIVFLASEQAAYINGINLPVDGGRTSCL